MSATDILASYGFTSAAELSAARKGAAGTVKRNKVVVRVRTSKGWVYEKFSEDNLEAEIADWVVGMEPEA